MQICRPYQANIISAVRSFLAHKPHDETEDSQDVLAELMEAVRGAVGLNYAIAIDPNVQVIDLIFAIAHNGPTSMHLTSLVHDLFQDIAEELYESFVPLCEKMLPFLSVALDVGPDGKNHPLMDVSMLVLSIYSLIRSLGVFAPVITNSYPSSLRLIFWLFWHKMDQSLFLTVSLQPWYLGSKEY